MANSKHTFKELQINQFDNSVVKGDIGMGEMFTMNTKNLNYPENAKEIAKRVNMHDELMQLLIDSQTAIEIAINATPSGEFRNTLTNLNIKVLSATSNTCTCIAPIVSGVGNEEYCSICGKNLNK